MSIPPNTPIVIGVADVKNPSTTLDHAHEPAALMHDAIALALSDTGLPAARWRELARAIDGISVVACWTWPYGDLPGLLAEKLGDSVGVKVDGVRRKVYSAHGGNQPAKLVDEGARWIAEGEGGGKVVVVTGGEALASLSAYAAAKKMPPPGWTKPAQDVESVFSPTSRDLGNNLGAIHHIGAPIQLYPLYENAFRAHRGQSIQENHLESAQLYAEFAKVAETHEYAWNHGKKAATADGIAAVSKKNRMICFPYPLLMNAFNTVNLASACILTSVGYAEELGVPRDRWIFPLGGAGTQDSSEFWLRPNYHSSPSITRSLEAALQVSNVTTEQIDLIDLYSCFPIVPKLAAEALSLSLSAKPLTLLGGLTSFGGAGNNYSLHAITEMTRQLRSQNNHNDNNKDQTPRTGLILANGGWLTYQHVLILSSHPRSNSNSTSTSTTTYPPSNPLPQIITDLPIPDIHPNPEGPAIVETYTVDFDRAGNPVRGHVVGRLLEQGGGGGGGGGGNGGGKRFLANHGDEATLRQLASWTVEPVGRKGWVSGDGGTEGRNVFVFGEGEKL